MTSEKRADDRDTASGAEEAKAETETGTEANAEVKARTAAKAIAEAEAVSLAGTDAEATASSHAKLASGLRPTRPILFLDVDGPLNPYAAPNEDHPAGYGTHRMRPASWAQDYPPVCLPGGEERIPTLRVWLNPAHGKALLGLPVELVWATTWEHEANEWIGPHLDLPELPVVAWREHDIVYGPEDGTFWKTHPVAAYAAGRPFAWFDDQIEEDDIRWCEENYPAPTLLLPIDPAVGLRDADFEAVARWASEL